MKMLSKIFFSCTITTLFISLTLSAATLYVSATQSGQYTTLSAAYTAAANGDTILIGPGTYGENIGLSKRLNWVGAGWDQTVCTGTFNFYTNASSSRFEGIKFEVDGVVINENAGADSVTIRRCWLIGTHWFYPTFYIEGHLFVEDCLIMNSNTNGYAVEIRSTASPIFRSCIFTSLTGSRCFARGESTGPLEIYNCIFLNYNRIFEVGGTQSVVAINNIFYDWAASPTFGTYPLYSWFDYNASQTIAAPGTNTISITSNPFVNYSESLNYQEGISNLHLVTGSGLIDTGYPSWIDLDLTRSDFGVYGGPRPLVDNGIPPYPWTVNMTITPSLISTETEVNASAVGRIGPQY